MTDWRRLAEHFEEKASITQMWLDEAIEALEVVRERDFDVRGVSGEFLVADFLDRYEKEKDG